MSADTGIVLTIVAIGLCGCSSFREDLVPPTAGTTARAVDRYCTEMADLTDFRREFVGRVNDLTEVGDLSALDCDSDGRPDFGSGYGEDAPTGVVR